MKELTRLSWGALSHILFANDRILSDFVKRCKDLIASNDLPGCATVKIRMVPLNDF